jgi:hypothetical protein
VSRATPRCLATASTDCQRSLPGSVSTILNRLAPCHSRNRLTGQLKYDPQFVERIRRLEFPEFLYLPSRAGVLPVPSYARIGEAQAVYEPHLDAMDLKLAPDVLEVVQDALWWLTTQTYGGTLAAYREQLLNQ